MHVLNHIDNKLGEHGERVEKLFAEHMEDEMERYEQIQRRQSAIMENHPPTQPARVSNKSNTSHNTTARQTRLTALSR